MHLEKAVPSRPHQSAAKCGHSSSEGEAEDKNPNGKVSRPATGRVHRKWLHYDNGVLLILQHPAKESQQDFEEKVVIRVPPPPSIVSLVLKGTFT